MYLYTRTTVRHDRVARITDTIREDKSFSLEIAPEVLASHLENRRAHHATRFFPPLPPRSGAMGAGSANLFAQWRIMLSVAYDRVEIQTSRKLRTARRAVGEWQSKVPDAAQSAWHRFVADIEVWRMQKYATLNVLTKEQADELLSTNELDCPRFASEDALFAAVAEARKLPSAA
jgi:hypothetical protein